MNCKPDDLAVIRPSWGVPKERGAVVHVLRRPTQIDERVQMRDGFYSHANSLDGWLCDSRVTESFPCFIRSSHLRPIRGQEGEDEIIRLVGKPETEQA